MNHLHAVCSILHAHQRSNARTGRMGIRIYQAWIHRFTAHFVRYMGNSRRAGVYSQADHVPCCVGKTTF